MDGSSPDDFDELKARIRHFVDDDVLDRVGFVRLVKILRTYPVLERTIAYEYLVREVTIATGDDRHAQRQALARIADLVGGEPPEVITVVSRALKAA